MNFFDKFSLFFLISLKKFQAKTNITDNLSFILFFEKIGILTPGINFPCLNLLSSII